jgi:hypothetical protein
MGCVYFQEFELLLRVSGFLHATIAKSGRSQAAIKPEAIPVVSGTAA